MKARHRCSSNKSWVLIYAVAWGVSVATGFAAGAWAPAFWLSVGPFILKGIGLPFSGDRKE